MERTNGTFKLQDVCVSGSDDHVLAVQRFGATVDGEERFFDASSVMHFSDGRQKERWFHIHDLSAFDEFIARCQRRSGFSAGPPPWAEPSPTAATSFLFLAH